MAGPCKKVARAAQDCREKKIAVVRAINNVVPKRLNMIIGVLQKFERILQLQGVGFRAQITGKKMVLNLGYSNPISIEVPIGIEIKV